LAGNESIIEVIQKMVQEGQPREKIIQTLRDLGVEEDQAKKLLMIAEADTFTLLKKEIGVLVRDQFASEKKGFEEVIHKDLARLEEEEKGKVKQLAMSELSSAQDAVLNEAKSFEDRINKTLSASEKTVSLVRVALDSINQRIAQMELDVEQMKVHKFRKKSLVFSFAMLGLGAVILVVALFLFFINFGNIDLAQIVMLSILIMASITLMFASIVG